MLKLSKHLSLFPLKWLIEIVFTEQSPADENIHPLPVSKQKSYAGLSTFLNLTDTLTQSLTHSTLMSLQRRMKNNTDFFRAGYLCLAVLQFFFW